MKPTKRRIAGLRAKLTDPACTENEKEIACRLLVKYDQCFVDEHATYDIMKKVFVDMRQNTYYEPGFSYTYKKDDL